MTLCLGWKPGNSRLTNGRPVFGTIPFELHRKRRAAISSIFSKAQAIQEEEAIYNRVDVLLKRIDDHIARDGFAELRMKYVLVLCGRVSANKPTSSAAS